MTDNASPLVRLGAKKICEAVAQKRKSGTSANPREEQMRLKEKSMHAWFNSSGHFGLELNQLLTVVTEQL